MVEFERTTHITILFCYWLIPENIHTIPQAASLNYELREFFWTGIQKALGGNSVWNSKCMGSVGGVGRGLGSESPEGNDTDLITFPFVNHQLWKQVNERSIRQMLVIT